MSLLVIRKKNQTQMVLRLLNLLPFSRSCRQICHKHHSERRLLLEPSKFVPHLERPRTYKLRLVQLKKGSSINFNSTLLKFNFN